MPSEAKALLTAQTEKPNHYSYLKEFRVEQCSQFLQHKCTQHRPFTCFHWHFMNQRRRRPVRKRDGSFNYSADNYCTKYDETTGLCPDGDECQFLHRTAGDTERRYHLRYYKTCMCVHDTDSRGYCAKNGLHCAFAHGSHDLRPPVYDLKEIQALENAEAEGSSANGPNALDKERNLMNEDPKWQDTNYVLANYKTEACKRPPRLCRQGYACPQYHNSKDKRRSPRKFKYRSTPCPSVKHGEEWGEPSGCDAGDQCAYCHTRTEQQFHPEIYKSTKCNDVQQAGYCPRGVFCAFAHVEPVLAEEMNVARDAAAPLDAGTNLADLLNSALPQSTNQSSLQQQLLGDKKDKSSDSSNGSGEVSESASTSSIGSNSSHSKAPGAQLSKPSSQHQNNIGNNQSGFSSSVGGNNTGNSGTNNVTGGPHGFGSNTIDYRTELSKQMLALESDPTLSNLEREQRKQGLCVTYSHLNSSLGQIPYFGASDTVESVVGNALDDLHLDEALNLSASLDNDLDTSSPTISNSISVGLASSGLLGGSAPVNIPRSSRAFSPSTASPLQHLQTSFIETFNSSKISSFSGLFDFSTNMSPGSSRNHHHNNSFSISPSLTTNLDTNNRLREELVTCRAQSQIWEERVTQARTACEAWQRETEEAKRKASIAEAQRDEALTKLKSIQLELDRLQQTTSPYIQALRGGNGNVSGAAGSGGVTNSTQELRNLSLSALKSLQTQLRSDLEEVDKALYFETATKCMVCEEHNRSVTLVPCNHYVLCNQCAPLQKECPYCNMPISISNNM
ncbi:putative E3 ubiquitin-protein ligase UNKL [Chrysoperla carnea]|uniref:putative E3 ubiquitin-protein ligase UNKL n=1 Tax=Chrysoperla carnea TaxID=189513 RepID=UPI001D0867CB|nr:putative E3 ubiquitin-protein ligase UNKL [Chrysoperla carnea]